MTEQRPKTLEELRIERGLRMTGQRRVIAGVLQAAIDHPDVEQLYRRAAPTDPNISISTAYRTVKLFEDFGIVEKHGFCSARIEALQEEIAREPGYRIVDHRPDLHAVPLDERDRGGD